MLASQSPERLILDLLRSGRVPLTFEEIIARLPELSWNQVFLSVDTLSRQGEIVLTRHGFDYHAAVAEHGAGAR